MSVRAPLREAKRSGALVRVHREPPLSHFDGFVIDFAAEHLVLAIVDDRIRFNGFVLLRLDLVSDVECPHPYASFYQRALELRKEQRPPAPELTLATAATAIAAAGSAFHVVAIHRETVEPDVCHIGQVVRVDDSTLELREISPEAVWDATPTPHELAEVTRVDFGGGYEEALALVAASLTATAR